MERVAVVRALPGLGDGLCAVPALRALRARFPGARISLVGLPAGAWLAERFPGLVDELVSFAGFPGIPEVPFEAVRSLAELAAAQAVGYDLALQLHGSGVTSNAYTALLGARRTAGFVLPGLPAPDPELFLPYPDDLPEPRRALALLAHLGAPTGDERVVFPLTGADREEAAAVAGAAGLAAPYVLLNPGATEAARRWSPAAFAAVGDALAARGLAVGLVGTGADAPVTAAVAAALRRPAADLAGRTSLGGLAALLAGAALLVTNDTGTSHLAAALGVPSVVVFLASDPRRWAPLDAVRHRALEGRSPDVHDRVLAAAGDLLARFGA